MSKKEWFVTMRNLQPSELEYYLESQAANGYILKKLGELCLFYYEFEEGKSTKTKYVVDKSALPKELYLQTLTEKGWELMGTAGPFFIWRQDYTDKRPEDFTDYTVRAKMCKIMAIVCAIITFVLVFLMAGYGYAIYQEKQLGVNTHFWIYLIGVVGQIPFIYLFGRAFKKFKDAN